MVRQSGNIKTAEMMYSQDGNQVITALETGPGCQTTVDKILQEIRSKGARRSGFTISKGTANKGRTGNPTNRTDELDIYLSPHTDETYTHVDQRSDKLINNIMNSQGLLKSWADRIVANCSKTAIVGFTVAQSDFTIDYYIQSDGTTKSMDCVNTETPPSILRWGTEWGPQC